VFFCCSSALASCNSELINNSTAKTQNAPSNLTRVVIIRHQRFGALFYLKAKNSLENRLAKMGWSVEWTEFVAGQPILKAIEKGKNDSFIFGHSLLYNYLRSDDSPRKL
jgi:sulfonate transport system substrate-binding protein